MPNTTNFSWVTPADTDLVKDGALAIRTLGNGIDTSLVDLKGGTTGQALTKATNTDLDYSWTDIIPASSAFLAGKNKIINGDFGIWQRGTSFTNPSNTYVCDRFFTIANGSGGTITVSRQTFTPGTAPVAGYESSYFLRFALTGTETGSSVRVLDQKIEDVRQFAGQTVTFSFWAKASTTETIGASVIQAFGSGGSADVGALSSTINLTTNWVRYTLTGAIPSISGKTIGANSSLIVRLNLPINETFQIDTWGWQLEAGSVATAFQTATGNPASELAACQRYYWRATNNSTNDAMSPTGTAISTTSAIIQGFHPVGMRVAPTSVDYSNVRLYDGVNVFTPTSITQAFSNVTTYQITVAVASGLTQYRPYYLIANTGTSYAGMNAEF